jgi:C6 transcription factor Pro1
LSRLAGAREGRADYVRNALLIHVLGSYLRRTGSPLSPLTTLRPKPARNSTISMSETLRSNAGCWTCRVRRKKCDEAHPACLTCTSLHIPCYGYGPKPVWMDRGAKEREIAKSLRNTVKQTISLQRVHRSRQSSEASETVSHEPTPSSHSNEASSHAVSSAQDILVPDIILPESHRSTDRSNTSSPFNESPSPRLFGSQGCPTSLRDINHPSLAAAAIARSIRNEAFDLVLTNSSWSALPLQFEEDQASLLMHFFDHVLPLQFRFYNPSISEGGRGWLLSILTRTKPLYHVALSLAAYHQQSILVRVNQIPCTASLRKLEERHIECIKALRCHLEQFPIGPQANTCEMNIEIMACIALLIALEVSLACSDSLVTTDNCDYLVVQRRY